MRRQFDARDDVSTKDRDTLYCREIAARSSTDTQRLLDEIVARVLRNCA